MTGPLGGRQHQQVDHRTNPGDRLYNGSYTFTRDAQGKISAISVTGAADGSPTFTKTVGRNGSGRITSISSWELV